MPKISVLMSVYNGEKYLKEAIDSILNQTYKDFEFIIFDDGSTDGSRKIIESYDDSRIKFFHKENSGLTKTLNIGLDKCSGEYVARIDADDISMPERFEKQVKFLDTNKDVMMCGSCAYFINEEGKVTGEYNNPTDYETLKKKIIFHNPFIHSTVMARKEVFEKIGKYNESFPFAQDYELWTRVLPKMKAINLSEKLLYYRIVQGGITKKNNLKVRMDSLRIRFFGLLRLLFS